MHADPTLPVVKVKSIEVTINATVDVAYVDDIDDEEGALSDDAVTLLKAIEACKRDIKETKELQSKCEN